MQISCSFPEWNLLPLVLKSMLRGKQKILGPIDLSATMVTNQDADHYFQ